MMAIGNDTSLRPGKDLLPRSTGSTGPSGAASPRRGGFSSPPELGAEVRFQRMPTHHPETGFVRGRMYGTGTIEVIDMDGKPLRLEANQYEPAPQMPTPAHGRQPSPVSPPPEAGEGIGVARTCPPCNHDCNQGRDCHARVTRDFPAGWWIIPGALVGALLWWALIKAVLG